MPVRRILKNLDWGDITLAAFGGFSILLALLDFTDRVVLTDDEAVRLILICTGSLMGAVALLSGRRKAEIEDLKWAIGQAEIKKLDMRTEFPDHAGHNAGQTQRFILDTNLSNEVPRVGTSSPQDLYYQKRHEKLMNDQISFHQVVSIFHREAFESVIKKLIAYRDKEYYVRHYFPPPKAIPILHMMSFDNEHFYIGGFHPTEPIGGETAIYIRHSLVNQLLEEYWSVLWTNAIPLKEGKRIYFERLEEIAKGIGLDDEEFEEMIRPLKETTEQ